MTDWMDDLLTELPSEPQPPDLDRRIRAGLSDERRKERRLRRGIRAALVGAAALGLWLAAPALSGLAALLPRVNGESLGDWAGLFVASPPTALNAAVDTLASWASRAAERLEPALVLALVLIAVPALNAVAALVRDVERTEEGLA
jgi:hypothetical protein